MESSTTRSKGRRRGRWLRSRQQRIVGKDGSHPGQDRIRGVAHAVYFAARCLARDPIRAAAGALRGRNAPIEGSGNLHGYERQRRGDVPGEAIVELAGTLLQPRPPAPRPRRAQSGNARATNQRIGILRRHHHPGHARG